MPVNNKSTKRHKGLTVSIFTPSHNEKYLKELWDSIKFQDFYEWVIVVNGDLAERMSIHEIKQLFCDDSTIFGNVPDKRIKIHVFENNWVGALKAYACSKCRGDILLEVDHDDCLTDTAIEEVKNAFSSDPNIGFVYSNCASFREDGTPVARYAENNGWKYRPFEYKERILDEVVSFPPTPASVSRIWYAPNHLRAWRRSVYESIGGHNIGMRVLDDQELLSRTYLATEFYHIDKCLYLYRITDSNTWLNHNEEIQANVLPIHCRYIQNMGSVWAARNELLALDLGGRFHVKPGFISVDLKNADVCTDLNEDWPFETSSVGCIIADDILEHLKDPIHVMKEAHRVLCDGGLLLISVPSSDGRGAYQDPTHISFWNQNSIWYYTRAEQSKFIDTPVKFQDIHTETHYPSQWHEIHNISYVRSHLAAIKDTEFRHCGPIYI